MSELTLLILRIGFLLLLWGFVFAMIYALRSDVFGARVRRQPAAAGAASAPAPAPAAPRATPRERKPQAASAPAPRRGAAATIETVSTLVVTSGPKAGLEVSLGTEPLSIGRSSESGLVIRDDYTSSHHARLMLWGDQWMLQDLDSTNGTFLGGERVHTPVPVNVGDPIKVGATTFELRA